MVRMKGLKIGGFSKKATKFCFCRKVFVQHGAEIMRKCHTNYLTGLNSGLPLAKIALPSVTAGGNPVVGQFG
jgi:hypothetical protein